MHHSVAVDWMLGQFSQSGCLGNPVLLTNIAVLISAYRLSTYEITTQTFSLLAELKRSISSKAVRLSAVHVCPPLTAAELLLSGFCLSVILF